ncbi:MAG: hypothetical protein HY908_18550 [Myxococcales bacterium]|nr:hypothetical protein [Myxococcales bacterium]
MSRPARPARPVVGLALALGAAVAASAIPARAAPPAAGAAKPASSSLGWSRLPGAESCIGSSELARAVEKLLGRSVFVSAAQADVAVEGHVEPVGGAAPAGWRAVITMADRSGKPLGSREIPSTDRSCRALDEPVALAVALMIDPDALSGPPPPPPPPDPVEPTVVPIYVPVPGPAPPPPADAEPPWHIAGRAGLSVGLGVLPTVAPGLEAALVVEPPWFIALEGTAAAYLPRPVERDGASADFVMAHAGIALCPVTRRFGGLELSVCAELQLGSLWADGTHGDGSDYAQHQLVANAASRVRLGYRVWGPFSVGLGFAGAVALVRPPFEAHDAAGRPVELFRLSPLMAVPDLALGAHFP